MSKVVSVETLAEKKVSRGTQLGQRLLPWLVPVGLILLWQIASSTSLLESRILPAPSAVVIAFWNLLLSGEFVDTCQSECWPCLKWFISRWWSRADFGSTEWFIQNGFYPAGYHLANDP